MRCEAICVLGALAAVMLAASAGVARAEMSPQLKAQIDRAAEQTLSRTGVPSASIAVVQDGAIAYVRAYGQAELSPSRPATPQMRYAVGSVSKEFTAAAILILAEQGKLTLDDPVGKYIPGLTRGDQITLRQMLSHTSGYRDFWPQDYVFMDMKWPATPQMILDRWAKTPLDFEPQTDWQYSNTGFVAAGLVVEKVSGQPLMKFLEDRVFKPLNMKSVVDFDEGEMTAQDAKPYTRWALGPQRPAPTAAKGWTFGAGQLAMRPEDLARWDISEINKSLLSASAYAEQDRSVVLTSGREAGYSLGFFVRKSHGRRLLRHNGVVSGFASENRIFPDQKAAIVVLTNADDSSAADGLADAIEAALFPETDATRVAREIFDGLRQGRIDRARLTANANDYFSAQAVRDFQESLAPLGEPASFRQVNANLRGGMTNEVYEVAYPGRKLKIVLRAYPDGRIEQFMVFAKAD